DKEVYDEVMERMARLSPGSVSQWGKMNVSQMLAHCKEAFKVPLSDKKMSRMFLGYLMGWMIKPKLYNESPWKRNLPTAPGFLIKDERDFEKEKQELSALVSQFHQGGPEHVGRYPHPMFGTFTKEQWGKAMYKHLDHHFNQFGV
ncbi:MAG TPA: DUF1569 domain-containing protein, partial [Ferruginibacter sp.]|nr:DUF1569 domain-containing protein [Ferruginibacter sp.]